jgi:hypothetical protein
MEQKKEASKTPTLEQQPHHTIAKASFNPNFHAESTYREVSYQYSLTLTDVLNPTLCHWKRELFALNRLFDRFRL